MAEQKETKNPVQSAERIFQVMEMLADHGEMGLMEISTALGLHKSTVHRLLMSLVYMGYAKQDEVSQKYMLSYKIVSMAGKMLDRMDILQVAKPFSVLLIPLFVFSLTRFSVPAAGLLPLLLVFVLFLFVPHAVSALRDNVSTRHAASILNFFMVILLLYFTRNYL